MKENLFVKLVYRISPLFADILVEQNIKPIKSYRLSKKYNGKFFVYKGARLQISPTAKIQNDGILKIGLSWNKIDKRPTTFVLGENANLIVKGVARFFSGCRVSVNENATMALGKDVFLNYGSNIRCFNYIEIGDSSRISEECVLSDSDNHHITVNDKESEMSKPIIIKEHCLIGLRSVILKGVTIKKGSVVGAGSVVTKDVSENTCVGGAPAKVIYKEVNWR